MKNQFDIQIQSFKTLLEINSCLNKDDFKSLLEMMDYDDISELSDADLKEVCIMSLQDNTPNIAAEFVIEQRLGKILKDNQIKNISVEMQEEKLWEEYADLSLHEELFNIGSFLFQVFPNKFPKPDAVKVTFTALAKNPLAKKQLSDSTDETLLVRLLSDGMDEKSVLHRLYDDQIKGSHIEDAKNILWIINTKKEKDDLLFCEVTSSGYWLDSLMHVDEFESFGYSD